MKQLMRNRQQQPNKMCTTNISNSQQA